MYYMYRNCTKFFVSIKTLILATIINWDKSFPSGILDAELKGDGLRLEVLVEGVFTEVLAKARALEATEGGGDVGLVVSEQKNI